MPDPFSPVWNMCEGPLQLHSPPGISWNLLEGCITVQHLPSSQACFLPFISVGGNSKSTLHRHYACSVGFLENTAWDAPVCAREWAGDCSGAMSWPLEEKKVTNFHLREVREVMGGISILRSDKSGRLLDGVSHYCLSPYVASGLEAGRRSLHSCPLPWPQGLHTPQ